MKLTTKRGQLLLSGVGTGKTWMFLGVVRRLRDLNFHINIGCVSPWPYIIVTKASIVEQTKRVAKTLFNLHHPRDVLIINIEQLRSKFGELFLEEKTIIENGEEHTKWIWRPMLYPCVVCWDECQQLMNTTSTQHKIAASYNELDNTWQIFSSATPFTRVAGAKCFCVATRIPQKVATFVESPLDNAKWPMFAKIIADPADPLEHSPTAIDKLMDKMDEFVVRVKGVKPQFKAKNRVQLIDFTTPAGKKYYEDTLERFERRKAKIEGSTTMSAGQKNVNMLVAMLQYRIAAEGNPDRIEFLVDDMQKDVIGGYASVCAVNFKQTIIKCIKRGREKYRWSRDDISLIWGGGTSAPTNKQKGKAAILQDDIVLKALKDAGITLDDIDLEDVDAMAEKEQLDPDLRLGPQSLPERQKEIDKFQLGRTNKCFYTFKAGGVGLSVHHCDELTKDWNRNHPDFENWYKMIQSLPEKQRPKPGKVRRKESGYAFVEDIPFIPTRPRRTKVTPTWSAVELVQGLGRAPRLTSLSDTEQVLVFLNGTIEGRVAQIVSMKLRCLGKVVRQKESWQDVIVGHHTDEQIDKLHLDRPEPEEEDEDELMPGDSDLEDEDND